MWEVEYTDEFEEWWRGLTEEQQEALDDRVMLLAEHGPIFKRPVVGEITWSRHPNMKELRVSKAGALPVPLVFDPRRPCHPVAGRGQVRAVGGVIPVGDPGGG